jgi:hypothetical protein
MISTPGIKSILKCDAGTLETTPTNPVYAGFRNEAKLTFVPYKAPKDYLNRQFRNMLQATLEYETMQSTMLALKANFGYLNLNMDAQLMTAKQSITSGSEDVFKFAQAGLLLGLGFEYSINADKRTIKETLKGAGDYDTVKTIINASSTNTAVTISGITQPGGENTTKTRRFRLMTAESPSATVLFNAKELTSFTFSLKTKDNENLFGQTLVDRIEVKFEVIGKDGSITKIMERLNKNINESLLLKFGNNSSFCDSFDFNSGVLHVIEEPEISDTDRNLKLTLGGDVSIYEFDFLFGADKGGGAADNGADGGTCKVGY